MEGHRHARGVRYARAFPPLKQEGGQSFVLASYALGGRKRKDDRKEDVLYFGDAAGLFSIQAFPSPFLSIPVSSYSVYPPSSFVVPRWHARHSKTPYLRFYALPRRFPLCVYVQHIPPWFVSPARAPTILSLNAVPLLIFPPSVARGKIFHISAAAQPPSCHTLCRTFSTDVGRHLPSLLPCARARRWLLTCHLPTYPARTYLYRSLPLRSFVQLRACAVTGAGSTCRALPLV